MKMIMRSSTKLLSSLPARSAQGLLCCLMDGGSPNDARNPAADGKRCAEFNITGRRNGKKRILDSAGFGAQPEIEVILVLQPAKAVLAKTSKRKI